MVDPKMNMGVYDKNDLTCRLPEDWDLSSNPDTMNSEPVCENSFCVLEKENDFNNYSFWDRFYPLKKNAHLLTDVKTQSDPIVRKQVAVIINAAKEFMKDVDNALPLLRENGYDIYVISRERPESIAQDRYIRATPKNVRNFLKSLNKQDIVSNEDHLFIYIPEHGLPGKIVLENGYIESKEFDDMVSEIKFKKLTINNEQCFGASTILDSKVAKLPNALLYTYSWKDDVTPGDGISGLFFADDYTINHSSIGNVPSFQNRFEHVVKSMWGDHSFGGHFYQGRNYIDTGFSNSMSMPPDFPLNGIKVYDDAMLLNVLDHLEQGQVAVVGYVGDSKGDSKSFIKSFAELSVEAGGRYLFVLLDSNKSEWADEYGLKNAQGASMLFYTASDHFYKVENLKDPLSELSGLAQDSITEVEIQGIFTRAMKPGTSTRLLEHTARFYGNLLLPHLDDLILLAQRKEGGARVVKLLMTRRKRMQSITEKQFEGLLVAGTMYDDAAVCVSIIIANNKNLVKKEYLQLIFKSKSKFHSNSILKNLLENKSDWFEKSHIPFLCKRAYSSKSFAKKVVKFLYEHKNFVDAKNFELIIEALCQHSKLELDVREMFKIWPQFVTENAQVQFQKMLDKACESNSYRCYDSAQVSELIATARDAKDALKILKNLIRHNKFVFQVNHLDEIIILAKENSKFALVLMTLALARGDLFQTRHISDFIEVSAACRPNGPSSALRRLILEYPNLPTREHVVRMIKIASLAKTANAPANLSVSHEFGYILKGLFKVRNELFQSSDLLDFPDGTPGLIKGSAHNKKLAEFVKYLYSGYGFERGAKNPRKYTKWFNRQHIPVLCEVGQSNKDIANLLMDILQRNPKWIDSVDKNYFMNILSRFGTSGSILLKIIVGSNIDFFEKSDMPTIIKCAEKNTYDGKAVQGLMIKKSDWFQSENVPGILKTMTKEDGVFVILVDKLDSIILKSHMPVIMKLIKMRGGNKGSAFIKALVRLNVKRPELFSKEQSKIIDRYK